MIWFSRERKEKRKKVDKLEKWRAPHIFLVATGTALFIHKNQITFFILSSSPQPWTKSTTTTSSSSLRNFIKHFLTLQWPSHLSHSPNLLSSRPLLLRHLLLLSVGPISGPTRTSSLLLLLRNSIQGSLRDALERRLMLLGITIPLLGSPSLLVARKSRQLIEG